MDFIKNLKKQFKNKELLDLALTHRSWVNENRNKRNEHNERIEFLGDAVLELLMSEHLFNTSEDDEGDMTINRVKMENNKMLSQKAEEMKIWDHVLIGEIETMNPTMKRETYNVQCIGGNRGRNISRQRIRCYQRVLYSKNVGKN